MNLRHGGKQMEVSTNELMKKRTCVSECKVEPSFWTKVLKLVHDTTCDRESTLYQMSQTHLLFSAALPRPDSQA